MRFGPRSTAACLAAAIATLAACSRPRSLDAASAAQECTRCHGGTDNASGAPPRDLLGRTGTTLPSVGAHTSHVRAGIDCSACHLKPATTATPTHPGGKVLPLPWSPLATANGTLSPVFDEATGTCSDLYCHGKFFGGNAANAPSWMHVGEGGAACGTCHAIPPPSSTGHPQRTDCGQCHGGFTSTAVNAATHVNGRVDVLPLACTTCHGDPSRAATAVNPQLAAAPPVDSRGNVAASSPGVGAHQAHLADGALRAALPCTECHAVPASLDGHPNGVTSFTWGPLARTGSAAPAYVGGACASTYCHGATLQAGGTNHAPSWTGGAAEVACGTCHGVPPPAPHPQNTSCGTCHAGYTSTTVNPATHVNGQPDVVGLSCTSCHGDSGRAASTANPQLPAAPPVDTHGSAAASSPGVGAHQAHLTDGPVRLALACTHCHAVPTSLGHANGVVDFQWSALATSSFLLSPSYAGAGGACASTYCHGASLQAGGTNHLPAWIGGPPEAACGTCHAVPPPAASGHVQSTNCGGCHPGYSATSVNRATHVDGQIQVSFSCTSCHGDAARAGTALNPQLSAAPPVDTHGNADPAVAGVGAHQAHLQAGPLRTALPCTECHVVPANLTTHPTGTTTFGWGPLATASGASPAYAGGTCTGTYCHGATLQAGGTSQAPSWTGGAAAAACGTCHGAPPPSPHPQTTACGGCHGAGYGAATVNPATHVNGTLDLLPLSCTSCHGDAGRAATATNPQLPAAPPVDTHGNTGSASAGVGAHQAHLTDGALRVALACTDCHVVPASTSHSNGTVDLAWSALATANGATTPAYAAGTCASTYCHGATLSAGGTNQAPSWTGGAAQAACGTCHGAPPPSPHPQNPNCGGCHGDGYGYDPVAGTGTVNALAHVNGTVDFGAIGCTSCHGDSTKQATPQAPLYAAPPVDTYGQTVSARVGKHQAHLVGSAIASPIACTQCHPVPSGLAGHPTGVTDFAWGNVATGAITATTAVTTGARHFESLSTTSPSYAGGSCAATYCHGGYSGVYAFPVYDYGLDQVVTNYAPYAGSAASPSWSGTAACGSCHGIPPGGTVWHGGAHSGGNDCSLCHPDAAGTVAAGTVRITNAALHADGKVDLSPRFTSTCTSCH